MSLQTTNKTCAKCRASLVPFLLECTQCTRVLCSSCAQTQCDRCKSRKLIPTSSTGTMVTIADESESITCPLCSSVVEGGDTWLNHCRTHVDDYVRVHYGSFLDTSSVLTQLLGFENLHSSVLPVNSALSQLPSLPQPVQDVYNHIVKGDYTAAVETLQTLVGNPELLSYCASSRPSMHSHPIDTGKGPGVLSSHAMTADDQGNLWLYGGFASGISSKKPTIRSDMWMFDPLTKQWEKVTPHPMEKDHPGNLVLHQMFWHPTFKQIVVVGGFGDQKSSKTPLSFYKDRACPVYMFDTKRRRWSRVRQDLICSDWSESSLKEKELSPARGPGEIYNLQALPTPSGLVIVGGQQHISDRLPAAKGAVAAMNPHVVGWQEFPTGIYQVELGTKNEVIYRRRPSAEMLEKRGEELGLEAHPFVTRSSHALIPLGPNKALSVGGSVRLNVQSCPMTKRYNRLPPFQIVDLETAIAHPLPEGTYTPPAVFMHPFHDPVHKCSYLLTIEHPAVDTKGKKKTSPSQHCFDLLKEYRSFLAHREQDPELKPADFNLFHSVYQVTADPSNPHSCQFACVGRFGEGELTGLAPIPAADRVLSSVLQYNKVAAALPRYRLAVPSKQTAELRDSMTVFDALILEGAVQDSRRTQGLNPDTRDVGQMSFRHNVAGAYSHKTDSLYVFAGKRLVPKADSYTEERTGDLFEIKLIRPEPSGVIQGLEFVLRMFQYAEAGASNGSSIEQLEGLMSTLTPLVRGNPLRIAMLETMSPHPSAIQNTAGLLSQGKFGSLPAFPAINPSSEIHQQTSGFAQQTQLASMCRQMIAAAVISPFVKRE
eukprot:gnl/Dysnectes_brevis/1138_a1270_4289.p1 GENE.gnl/Dysnectes_brevis/1138_a1270_4289~~gnl/Dysnectes_brevis/1138_a1270_4289.p1  ORF type:complete len:845 (-),score=218.86 gnl/Dysnectes_brevis/1138_a1270_4289:138-2609(-)